MINKNLFRNTRRVSLSFKSLVWFDLGICIFLLILFVMSTSRYEILKTKQNFEKREGKNIFGKSFCESIALLILPIGFFPKDLHASCQKLKLHHLRNSQFFSRNPLQANSLPGLSTLIKRTF